MERTQSSQTELKPWLDTLHEIASSLGPQRSFQANLSRFLNLLTEKHDFRRPHLVLFEPETGLLRLSLSAEGATEAHEASYKPGVGITGQVFATGKSVIVGRMKGDPLFLSLLFDRSDEEMEKLAFISVPILAPGSDDPYDTRDVIGTLNADTLGGDEADLEWRRTFLEIMASMIANEAAHLQEELSGVRHFAAPVDMGTEDAPFIAQSKSMRHILEQIAHLAQGKFPVLLRGESGTGKERLARRLHASSPRSEVPLTVCYCGTIPAEKMQAELSGYQKGAFPGALQTCKGFFEQANKGTLFLESVEDLTPEAQQDLLRLLQDRQVIRLGASNPVPSDVRVIASSSAPLEKLVEEGRFSMELFARLNVCAVTVPPLRERREDIIPSAEAFLREIGARTERPIKRISYPALDLLTQYLWPGNLAELRSCMERVAENSEDQVIRAGDLPPSIQTAESTSTANALSLGDAVIRFEKEMLVDALVKAGGNMLKAAKELKTSYRIVNYKVKKYEIDPHRFAVRRHS